MRYILFVLVLLFAFVSSYPVFFTAGDKIYYVSSDGTSMETIATFYSVDSQLAAVDDTVYALARNTSSDRRGVYKITVAGEVTKLGCEVFDFSMGFSARAFAMDGPNRFYYFDSSSSEIHFYYCDLTTEKSEILYAASSVVRQPFSPSSIFYYNGYILALVSDHIDSWETAVGSSYDNMQIEYCSYADSSSSDRPAVVGNDLYFVGSEGKMSGINLKDQCSSVISQIPLDAQDVGLSYRDGLIHFISNKNTISTYNLQTQEIKTVHDVSTSLYVGSLIVSSAFRLQFSFIGVFVLIFVVFVFRGEYY